MLARSPSHPDYIGPGSAADMRGRRDGRGDPTVAVHFQIGFRQRFYTTIQPTPVPRVAPVSATGLAEVLKPLRIMHVRKHLIVHTVTPKVVFPHA